jgi:hypothetical protein
MKRAIVVAALCVSGCSGLFMERAASGWRPEQGEPRCTASDGWALWDAAAAGLNVAAGAAVYAGTPPSPGREVAAAANRSLLILGAAAAVHAISSVAGFGWASTCRGARAGRDRYLVQREALDRDRARNALPQGPPPYVPSQPEPVVVAPPPSGIVDPF